MYIHGSLIVIQVEITGICWLQLHSCTLQLYALLLIVAKHLLVSSVTPFLAANYINSCLVVSPDISV